MPRCSASELGCRCVLINPAVNPARDLADRIGTTTMWHSDDEFHFRTEHVEQLRRMTPATLTNQARTLAIIAKGDEVLDWREMAARHAGSQLVVVEGSDHALSDFDLHLPRIADFLQAGARLRGGIDHSAIISTTRCANSTMKNAIALKIVQPVMRRPKRRQRKSPLQA